MLGLTASASVANTCTAAGSTDTITAITNSQRTGYTFTAATDDSTETYDAAGRTYELL
jgi:hypothetical protein